MSDFCWIEPYLHKQHMEDFSCNGGSMSSNDYSPKGHSKKPSMKQTHMTHARIYCNVLCTWHSVWKNWCNVSVDNLHAFLLDSYFLLVFISSTPVCVYIHCMLWKGIPFFPLTYSHTMRNCATGGRRESITSGLYFRLFTWNMSDFWHILRLQLNKNHGNTWSSNLCVTSDINIDSLNIWTQIACKSYVSFSFANIIFNFFGLLIVLAKKRNAASLKKV